MSECCQESLCCNPEDLHQAFAIHTRKITDSCRDKDCIEDLRVYLTESSQGILNSAPGGKVRCADLLYTEVDVEPVAFDRNHYCIDVTFYYRVLADATVGNCRPAALYGLAVFSKRAILCGEESAAHIFTSEHSLCNQDSICEHGSNLPTAVVEALDPMVLSSKVKDVCECKCSEQTAIQIPKAIRELFDEKLVVSGEQRRLFVTLGQFSIIRLERDAQFVVPIMSYSIPDKACCDSPGCAEDPCEMFSRIPFPTGRFTPTGCDCKPDCCDNG